MQWVGLNGGAAVWSFHYHWWELMPQPDHLLEWMTGLFVGISLVSLNATKLYYLISEKRKNKRKNGRSKV